MQQRIPGEGAHTVKNDALDEGDEWVDGHIKQLKRWQKPGNAMAPEAYVFGDGVAAATVAVKAWEMACGWTGEAAP